MADPITEPRRDPESGAWQFPTAWSPEARAEWEALAEDLAGEEKRLAKLEADAQAAATDPQRLMAAKRLELAEKKRLADQRTQEDADDRVWDELVERHGEGRLRRVFTENGSIILRGMTEAEVAEVQRQVDGVVKAALEAGDENRAAADSTKVYRRGLLTKGVLHPRGPKGETDAAEKIANAFPNVWPELYAHREDLNRGRRVALGKAAAR